MRYMLLPQDRTAELNAAGTDVPLKDFAEQRIDELCVRLADLPHDVLHKLGNYRLEVGSIHLNDGDSSLVRLLQDVEHCLDTLELQSRQQELPIEHELELFRDRIESLDNAIAFVYEHPESSDRKLRPILEERAALEAKLFMNKQKQLKLTEHNDFKNLEIKWKRSENRAILSKGGRMEKPLLLAFHDQFSAIISEIKEDIRAIDERRQNSAEIQALPMEEQRDAYQVDLDRKVAFVKAVEECAVLLKRVQDFLELRKSSQSSPAVGSRPYTNRQTPPPKSQRKKKAQLALTNAIPAPAENLPRKTSKKVSVLMGVTATAIMGLMATLYSVKKPSAKPVQHFSKREELTDNVEKEVIVIDVARLASGQRVQKFMEEYRKREPRELSDVEKRKIEEDFETQFAVHRAFLTNDPTLQDLLAKRIRQILEEDGWEPSPFGENVQWNDPVMTQLYMKKFPELFYETYTEIVNATELARRAGIQNSDSFELMRIKADGGMLYFIARSSHEFEYQVFFPKIESSPSIGFEAPQMTQAGLQSSESEWTELWK